MSEATTKKSYLSGTYDILFIIGAPVLSFTAVTLVSQPRAVTGHFLYDPGTPEWFVAASALITHAHVMMVFIRSHLNSTVFKQFPFRFTLVPLAMMLAFTVAPEIAGIMALIALYWDEWHTQMQTFGFGRIYDSRLGNDPHAGRKLDIGIAFVLGLLPHFLLLTYLPEKFRTDGLIQVFNMDRENAEAYGHFIHDLRYPLMAFGITYVLFYIFNYWKLVKNGYKISGKKMALLGSTAVTALLISSFYSIADAGHFMNIYHSLQYLFIVCILEAPQLSDKFKFPNINRKLLVSACGFFALTIAFMAGAARLMGKFSFLGNFWILSSLLHFWYDGFIWSVRKHV